MPNENEPLPEKKRLPIKWGTIGIYISTFAIVIAIFAATYGYSQLTTITITLTKVVTNLENELANTLHHFTSLQQIVNNFATTLKKSEELANKQEKILVDWQTAKEGNLDKWYVAEAQHLTRLANDHAQLSNSQTIMLALLQRASEALQNVKDPRISAIQQSLATDIANLQNAPQINVNELYVQLTNLDKQLNQLPLPITQYQPESQASSGMISPNLPWWKKGLERAKQALGQIVVVHYNGANTLPLITPEEKVFLYQNLHSKIENAAWGLLHQNGVIYQLSLQRALDWIQQYFVQDAEITKNILQNLQTLQKVVIQPVSVDLSATLQLFDEYFGKPASTPLLPKDGTKTGEQNEDIPVANHF